MAVGCTGADAGGAGETVFALTSVTCGTCSVARLSQLRVGAVVWACTEAANTIPTIKAAANESRLCMANTTRSSRPPRRSIRVFEM